MPGIAVALGGTIRHLLYDLNALCTLKTQGINLLSSETDERQIEDPMVLRALLWAGFLHETPDLTVEQVGSWVTMDRIEELATTFATALTFSTAPASPDGLEAITQNPPTAPATNGATATDSAMAS